MPIGFIGITKKIEKKIIKKKKNIYFGGTFSGNSLSMFVSNEFLKFVIKNKKKIFKDLEAKSLIFYNSLNNYIEKNNSQGKIKTTNINILLNRVRIENKKNILRKMKISLLIILIVFTISSIVFL